MSITKNIYFFKVLCRFYGKNCTYVLTFASLNILSANFLMLLVFGKLVLIVEQACSREYNAKFIIRSLKIP